LASILKKEGYCLSSLDSDGIQTWERFDYFWKNNTWVLNVFKSKIKWTSKENCAL
jgi:hypothetical protein